MVNRASAPHAIELTGSGSLPSATFTAIRSATCRLLARFSSTKRRSRRRPVCNEKAVSAAQIERARRRLLRRPATRRAREECVGCRWSSQSLVSTSQSPKNDSPPGSPVRRSVSQLYAWLISTLGSDRRHTKCASRDPTPVSSAVGMGRLPNPRNAVSCGCIRTRCPTGPGRGLVG